MRVDLLVKGIGEIATPLDSPGPLAGERQRDIKHIQGAALAVQGGRILALGKEREILDQISLTDCTQIIDVEGRCVIPGFVDPHTHLVYGGCRHEEFLWRLEGTTYQEILKKGGGILDTVEHTRSASPEELLKGALRRAWEAFYSGTTTLEVKSGYGLNLEREILMLEVAREIAKETPVEVLPTFLGAHAIPREFKNDREGYLRLITEEMLPAVRGKAEFVDVFCDEGAFTQGESREILKRAKELGFRLKIHADELTPSGGSLLAGELGTVSADHLENIDQRGMESLKRAGVVATLLPGTSFFLKLKGHAPARRLIEAGIPVALGTDHNPGTSPILSQAVIFGLGVFLLDLLPQEALTALTLNAAYALQRDKRIGSLEVGKQADFLVLDSHSYLHIAYEFGRNLVEFVVKKGKVYRRESLPSYL